MSDLKFQRDGYYYSSKLNLQQFGSHLFIGVPYMISAISPIHIERSVWPNILKTISIFRIVCDRTKSTHTAKIFYLAFLSIKIFRLNIAHSPIWPFPEIMSIKLGYCSSLKQPSKGYNFWVFKKSVWYNNECKIWLYLVNLNETSFLLWTQE